MLDPVRTLIIFQRQPDPQSFSAGQAVFKEGEPGDLMYGVLEGEIALSVNGKIVETIVPGGVFGIGALVSSSVRTYTAIAQTDCKLAFLDEKRFLFVVQETPFFALEVMKSYSERLNRLVRSLVEKLIV
ncbi:cyclic nucleotide-binding domain-containing protein [Phormidesmis priestleyi ULC007]|uniref:Cyclic nucleotide-binding domain-containing protein n=1 Tax=Phormidesmis priestleyi ULC007 TaxID=1920490 RepID=A0A2T1D9P4_9CYAN|nr:cyclic nucleotide-binding domain-containing protein [Phormidesmis priestleyi]PSB17202.1 cyclic nucleotide-binding domain-containing protein [Phormidesmis priestleyi ULC007]PZO47985.1 MAG: cyclic nucleotide-binding domain-containing protein [Phormidesmis priestleyi]